MKQRGSTYNPVLQSVLASGGQPFNLQGLAQATKLSANQAYNALVRLTEVGLVRVSGERHVPGQRGRGERIYQLANEAEIKPDSFLGRLYAVVMNLAAVMKFSTGDVQAQLGQRESGWTAHPSSIRLGLELLELRGVIARVLEVDLASRRGPAKRYWTSNPTNVAEQRRLLQLVTESTKKSDPGVS